MTSPERTAVKNDGSDWFRVEVIDHDGQIVAIETEMLAGRDIGEAERLTICRAIDHLAAFIGHDQVASLSERQDDQIGHSASPAGQADRSDALPEEPRHNDDCLARALGGACSCDLERRLRAYAAQQREDALEEAARICDKQEEYIRKREHTYYDTRIAQGAFECAAAIRAAAKRGKR